MNSKHFHTYISYSLVFNHTCAVHLCHEVLFDVEAADIKVVASALLVAIRLI